jgi:hypothetical protein
MKSDVVIIYDWDDTLFPTSWIMRQGIKISELADVNKYIVYFHELDDVVYELLKASILLGDVYIITNANIQWIKLSKRLLRKSSQLIDKYVNIISARDNYKEMYDMDEWKIHTFRKDIINQISMADQVISIGDAKYEYDALLSLKDYTQTKKLLKNIRFMSSPSFNTIIDQIGVVSKSIKEISAHNGHMDLKFSNM